MRRGEILKKAIGGIYSAAADRLYEPVVVRFGFPLLGGDVNSLALQHGRRAVDVATGEPILDMPVGTAYFAVQTARLHSGIVVGADIAEGMVVKTQDVARRARLTNLLAVRADAHRLPFKDRSFGAILCTNGLQVIPGLERSLEELARVLVSEGRLFCSIIAVPLGWALPPNLAARLPTLMKSRREVVSAFEQAGLSVQSVETNRFALLLEARRAL